MEAVSNYEIREELRRVLASKQFAKSRRRNRFLEFVCEQTLLGNGNKLSEYLIGVEVYERGQDFNAQEDAIVRVQASDIRRLLREYYDNEGKDNPWKIELPPGHYVPVFIRGAVTPGSAPASSTPGNPSRVEWRKAVVPALVSACLVLASLLIWSRSVQPAGPVRSSRLSAGAEWFWKPFLPPAEPPVIVLPNHPLLRPAHQGDSPQTLKSGSLVPKTKLSEFRSTVHFRELREFNFVPDGTDFTGVGEAVGLLSFFELFTGAGQKIRVKPARLVDFDAVKHGNAIVLGGTQDWSGRIFLYQEGFLLHAGVIENKHPQPGEQAVYKPEFDPYSNSQRRDYALVLMLPNGNREQRVLLTYGIYTKGTQAAIEYVTCRECLEDLRNKLIALTPGKTSPPPFFEVLLTTAVENDVPGKASFVAARIVPE